MNMRKETINLLHKLSDIDGQELPKGVQQSEMEDFERRNNILLSPNLQEQFITCNGAALGPGGIFGIRNPKNFLDIEYIWSLMPEWKNREWLPLASDGSGDYYVVDLECKIGFDHPVFFVDQSDLNALSYIVASDIWHFFRGLFLTEIEQDPETCEFYWPFDKEQVLKEDPALEEYKGTAPFAWDD